MITKKRKFGDLGEEIASKHLKSKGFIILSRNYLKPYGEIDIVCSKGGVIHFVEVKSVSREMKTAKNGSVSRVTGSWNPAERVDERKLKRLERVINTYLLEGNLDMEWQIDVALVFIDEQTRRARVELIYGAN